MIQEEDVFCCLDLNLDPENSGKRRARLWLRLACWRGRAGDLSRQKIRIREEQGGWARFAADRDPTPPRPAAATGWRVEMKLGGAGPARRGETTGKYRHGNQGWQLKGGGWGGAAGNARMS